MFVVLIAIVMSGLFVVLVTSGGEMDFAALELALRRKVDYRRPKLGVAQPHRKGLRAEMSEEVRPGYRSIVVGVDGTLRSLPVLAAAARIARDAGAELTVTCAYDDRAATPTGSTADLLKGDSYSIAPATAVEELLHVAAERARTLGAGYVVCRSRRGNPAEVLLESAADAAAELIVVGERTFGTPRVRWFGSLHSEVVRRSRTDVLVVRTAA